MKLLLLPCTLLLVSLPRHTIAQPPPDAPIKASSIAWRECFGSRPATPNTVYCLMASGFFRATTAPNFNTLVSGWLVKHPQAQVTSTASFGPVSSSVPESRIVWVWVTSGAANLNEFLVRQGACPVGTMVLRQITLPGENSKTDSEGLLLTQTAYRKFLQSIRNAEADARKNQRGIWHKKGNAQTPR